MTQDLVLFLDKGEDLETSLKDYLTWGTALYTEGQFKKIFDIIESKIV